MRNPRETVLERLRRDLKLSPARSRRCARGRLQAIAEHTEGATTINAGYETLPIAGSDVAMLNELQTLAKAPWNDARLDVFTFRLARAYLEQARPRVLFLSFNDTDSWAHEGRYDRVLDAYAASDRWLEQLWRWLQRSLTTLQDHIRSPPITARPRPTAAPSREKYPRPARMVAFAHRRWRSVRVARRLAALDQPVAAPGVRVCVDWNADHPDAAADSLRAALKRGVLHPARGM